MFNRIVLFQTILIPKHWSIPDTAPKVVHDALYELMEKDGIALTDVRLLIDKSCELSNKDAVVRQALFMPNGIFVGFREYPCIKSLKIPSSILSPQHELARHKLNHLVHQIHMFPDTDRARHATQTLSYLQESLTTKDATLQEYYTQLATVAYDAICKDDQATLNLPFCGLKYPENQPVINMCPEGKLAPSVPVCGTQLVMPGQEPSQGVCLVAPALIVDPANQPSCIRNPEPQEQLQCNYSKGQLPSFSQDCTIVIIPDKILEGWTEPEQKDFDQAVQIIEDVIKVKHGLSGVARRMPHPPVAQDHDEALYKGVHVVTIEELQEIVRDGISYEDFVAKYKESKQGDKSLLDIHWRHIFTPEIICENGKLRGTGFHHDYLGKLKTSGRLEYEEYKDLGNGFYEVRWQYANAGSKFSTFFPDNLTPAQVLKIIAKSFSGSDVKETLGRGKIICECPFNADIKIIVVLETDKVGKPTGGVITAYPAKIMKDEDVRLSSI